MKKWLKLVGAAFLLIAYLATGLGLVAVCVYAIHSGHLWLWPVAVFIGGPLLIGTAWHILDRSLR